MSFDSIKTSLAGQSAKHLFTLKTHSPKILFVAGTVGVVGTVVLACRATLKVGDRLDDYDKKANALIPSSGLDRGEDRTDYHKDLKRLKLMTALEIAKPYLPAVGLGLVSVAALTGSHVILTKRNTAVMGAYAVLQKGFDEYRGRVRDEYGVDVDRKFAIGAETVDVTEKLADGTTVTKKEDKVTGRFGGSAYAVIFDESSRKFSKEPGRNSMTVQIIQSYANDKLRAQGHLTLNEVLDMLDLPRSEAGFVVGWVYKDKTKYPEHTGDNYVDFGFFTGDSEDVASFIDGKNYYCVLDFNVDGIIYNKAV